MTPPRWISTTLCTLATAALLLVGWQLAITVSGLSPYLAKTPIDVWRYLSSTGRETPPVPPNAAPPSRR